MREFLPTIIGVMFKAVLDLLSGGEDAGGLGKGVLIFALILTLFGVLNTLKNRQTEKWKGLAIHAAIWVFGYFGFKLLAILVIIVVLAAVFTRGEIFAGLANMIGSASSGSTETFRYASFYYERSDEFKEWSLYNDCGNYAVLRNTENGNMVTVYPHNNDGLVSDDTGKLYYPK